MNTSGTVNSSSNHCWSSVNAVADLFYHQCRGTLSRFGVGCTAAANALDSHFLLRLVSYWEFTYDSCLKFISRDFGWGVWLNSVGLACLVYFPIVLRVLLLTFLVLQLIASKLSSACSRLIQQFFLPSLLFLRSSYFSSFPSIHTPSSFPSSPSDMFS